MQLFPRNGHALPVQTICASQFMSPSPGGVTETQDTAENQCDASLRRGIFFKPGMLPPMEANRRALSRSIRALRASRISADLSPIPVNSWAILTRSSSRVTVVLMDLITVSDDAHRGREWFTPLHALFGAGFRPRE